MEVDYQFFALLSAVDNVSALGHMLHKSIHNNNNKLCYLAPTSS